MSKLNPNGKEAFIVVIKHIHGNQKLQLQSYSTFITRLADCKSK